MNIIKNGPILIYLQVADWIIQQINSGAWPEHFQLPSEVDLALQLGIARGTVRKAIAHLTHKGVLVSIHGRGTFVSSKTLEQPLADQLIAFSEDLINKGIPFETQVIEQKLIMPSGNVASLLSIHDEPVLYLKRVRRIHNKPIVVLENFVVARLCPGIEQEDFQHQRLFDMLENKYGIRIGWGWRTFQAKSASDEIAVLLEGASCEPVMYLEQIVHQKDGLPVEFSMVWLKGDSFRLSSIVKRDQADNNPQSSIHVLST
jgi:DNA-binding GntR family transcriptional regulator